MLWSLAAASAAFWMLQIAGATPSDSALSSSKALLPSSAAPEPNLTPQVAAALGAKNATLLSPAGEMAALQARLQLQGVLAVGTKRGAALISVDGKPAKPYRVGSTIQEGLEVIALAPRSASIGQGKTTAFTLELPLQK